MKNLAVISDDFHLKHTPSFSHPERPERITSVINYLEEKKFFIKVDLIKPSETVKENILLVHTEEHFNFIVESIKRGNPQLDVDTYIVKDSLKAALLSSGAVINAVDLIMNKSYKNIFSLMRPPGHHAESKKPMGFCIFNNIAIGAQYAIDKYRLERIAIIDWDVHHGNGTQEIFFESSKVLFISLHQFPFYPGTGAENENGAGKGEDYTINYPLPAGTTGKTYLKIFNEGILKILEKFDPQLIFISAGFDAHKDDPLANMELTEDDFARMTEILKDFTDRKKLNIISVLEGGYNLEALAKSVDAHLDVLKS